MRASWSRSTWRASTRRHRSRSGPRQWTTRFSGSRPTSRWRGMAAQQLGRPDVSKRLEAAWRAVPTLTRLLRWLVADGGTARVFRSKAKKIVARCPRTAGRQLGLLHVLLGDLRAAADLLSKAPGLGWSSED